MGAARAERRRQERAAARLPEVVADRPTPVYARGGGDCMRGAMATLLGIPYEAAPEAHPTLEPDVYRAWLAGHGLVMSQSPTHAPVFVEFWIATVFVPRPHAIVMHADRLFHNPAPYDPPDDCRDYHVMSATIVGPRDWVDEANAHTRAFIAEGSPHVWALPAAIAGPRQPADPLARFIHRLI